MNVFERARKVERAALDFSEDPDLDQFDLVPHRLSRRSPSPTGMRTWALDAAMSWR